MLYRSRIRRWFGYTRRERSGTMVLAVILMGVVIVRITSITGIPGAGPDPATAQQEGLHSPDTARREPAPDAATPGSYSPVQGAEGSATMSERISTASPPRREEGIRAAGSADQPALYIDINRADSSELDLLPGIGAILSVRIVKYRDLLGGFMNTDQLLEVYGIEEGLLEKLLPLIFVDTMAVRRLDLNRAEYRDLLRHPYISREQTDLIMEYRRVAGPFRSKGALVVNRIFSEDEYSRVSPYLSLRDSTEGDR